MTLGYEEYLAALLRPLGVYDLQPGTINRGELAAYGRALDGAGEELDHTAREMSLTTARDFGLERIEALLPYRPVCQTARQRREALAALLRIGGDSFTLAAINDTITGCGIPAVVKELGTGQVSVSFPGTAGVPAGFEELKKIIEDILPTHLGIQYDFWFLLWRELEEWFPSWRSIEDRNMTWTELETCVKEF